MAETRSGSSLEQVRALPAPVQILGFESSGTASLSCSPQSRLPESPLAKLLKAQSSRQLPRLRIATKVAAPKESTCSNGLNVPQKGVRIPPDEDSGRASHASSLSRSSDPITIPETCRSNRSLPVQGQILEDLSLDADALCMLRFSPLARVAPTNSTSSGDVLEIGCSSLPLHTDAAIASSEVETLAVAQLRGLECHAKQGDDELHMVSLVESMRLAAEEHDRMLLECALLKARRMFDDCIFDLDLSGSCCAQPALVTIQRRCITA
ncbi:hypothetical protein COCOBI_12-2650 [Coccomyxa sp. Obi]|nr:hypothetical protein COCOBI_12-2650 [Coccomyxa sp. Obi]